MRRESEKDRKQREEWDREIALLEQGISPDGLPINPPGKSAGMMAYPDKQGNLVRFEAFIKDVGHFSYLYFKPKENTYVRGWFTVKKGERNDSVPN